MLDWSLLSGPAPIMLGVSGIAAAAWLLYGVIVARRRRRRWIGIAVIAGCALIAAIGTVTADYLARTVWMLFPDRLEPAIYGWVGAGVFAVVLAIATVVSERGRGRALATAVAGIIVVVACANQVNAAFGAYLTLRDALGVSPVDEVPLPDDHAHVRVLPDSDPVESSWSPRLGLTQRGTVASAPIPAPMSRFTARPAKIYLPPAYFTDPRAALPVLVLLPGQPGAPQDWLGAGKLGQTMDAFAAAHHGLAPVVVVVDGTGSQFGDPLCLDSQRGRADTYLARDVPAWIKTHLTVDPDPQGWAIAGASYGGTCALQLATNHPDVYPTFLDISGQSEPSLGNRPRTVAEAFGGDQAAFTRVNPLDLLRAHRFPGSAGSVVVGSEDRDAKRDAHAVYDATRAAGMSTRYTELPGSHTWRTFSAALRIELPWLAQRIGLTK